MLRITVELVPYGDESQRRTIGTMEICNVGGDRYRGEYAVVAVESRDGVTATRGGRISEWPRLDRGAWELVAAAVAAVTREGE